MMKYFTDFIIAVLIMILIIFISTVFGFRKLMVYISGFAMFFSFIFLISIAFDSELRSLGWEEKTIYHAALIMIGGFVYLWFFDKTK
jgi:purine-cytosine permease-like protein